MTESTDSRWTSTIICKSFWTDVKSELLPSQRLRSSQSLVDEKPQHCNLKKLAVMPLPEHHSIRVMSVVLIIKPQTNPCPRPNVPPCRYVYSLPSWLRRQVKLRRSGGRVTSAGKNLAKTNARSTMNSLRSFTLHRLHHHRSLWRIYLRQSDEEMQGAWGASRTKRME